MKKQILALVLSFLTVLPTFAEVEVEVATELPWTKNCARVLSFGDGQLANSYTEYSWVSSVWKDIEELMAPLFNKEKIKISFEYLQYRTGYEILSQAEYFPTCEVDPNHQDDAEVERLFEKSEAGTLNESDFRGPRWIHVIQAFDTEEANCLTLSKVNGVVGGCADQWQDGITKDEAVCFNNKTYLKCHIGCMEKIYNRKINSKPGFCPKLRN